MSQCLRPRQVEALYQLRFSEIDDPKVHAVEEPDADTLFTLASGITFTASEMPVPETIPAGLQNKVEIAPEAGTITLKGKFTATQAKALEGVFQTPAGKDTIRQALVRLNTPGAHPIKSPSERGELFSVPLLSLRQGDLWEPFEQTHLLQGDWRLLDYPCELGETEFKRPERTAQGGRFLVQAERVRFEYFDNIEAQLALYDFHPEWDQIQLVSWLDHNIPDYTILPDEKAAFLGKAVSWLMEVRSFTLADLLYSKVRLRAAFEEKIKEIKRQAMGKIHQALLFDSENFASDGCCEMIFEQGRYAYDRPYRGFTDLPKHFFPVIGNLGEDGEELVAQPT